MIDRPKRDRKHEFQRPASAKGRRPCLANLMQFQADAYEGMLVSIRMGSYDYQSAEKIGVTARSFARWLNKGQQEAQQYQDFLEELEEDEDLTDEERDKVWNSEYKPSCYCQFFLDVMRAQAEARTLREMQVANDSPFQWLRYGPGRTRERDGVKREGWTDFKDNPDLNVSITNQADVVVAPIMDDQGQEIVPTQDLVKTLEVLSDAGVMPSMTDMAQALLDRRERKTIEHKNTS